jgi:hypothetical protein
MRIWQLWQSGTLYFYKRELTESLQPYFTGTIGGTIDDTYSYINYRDTNIHFNINSKQITFLEYSTNSISKLLYWQIYYLLSMY